MRLINVLLVLMLFFPEDGISQKKKMNEHPFNGTFVLSLEGAVTTGMTDYKDYAFDYSGHGRLEYFFPLNSSFCLGLAMVGGAGYLSQDDANLSPNVRTDFLYGGGGVTFGYLIGRTVLLYVTGVPAYMWFNPKDNNGNLMPNNQSNLYDNFTLDITGGGGLRFLLSDNITFNITGGFHYADTDYLDDIANGSAKDIILTGGAGISISMGGVSDSDNDGVDDEIDQCPETPENVRVDEFGCPLDEDRDGVPDYLDKCLGTPENAPVDSLGCSKDSDGDGVPDLRDKCPDTEPGMIVNADGCSEDADGDGVPDGIDKCPGTTGIPVDKFGCPLDSDQDGVPDYKDDCPNTSVLEEVDENGCPEEKEYTLTISANFDPNSTEIKQASLDEMEKIIKYMRQDKKSKWLIQGHTDNTGTRAVNMRISRERAESVKDYLVERGIDPTRLTTEGVGPDQPVASNLTPEGRAENRRVVITKMNNK